MYLAKLFSSFISRDLVEGRELAKKYDERYAVTSSLHWISVILALPSRFIGSCL